MTTLTTTATMDHQPNRPLMHLRHFGFVLAMLLVTACALSSLSAQAATPIMDWSGVAARVVPSVVSISVVQIVKNKDDPAAGHRESFAGTGFIISPSGYIVTNRHVVANAYRITVTLHDHTELPATLVAAARLVDVAVLKVQAGHPLPALKWADVGNLRIGSPVLAVGNPLGLGISLSSGIVSAVNRDLMNTPFDDYVQTDAAINHGNSGGPLIDTNGKVVGINTILVTNSVGEGSNGLGFAISSDVADYTVKHLIDPARATVGWIGVHLQDVDFDLARAFGSTVAGGFVVTGTDPHSPARAAGLHSGDVILRFGALRPTDMRALMRDIVATPLGTTVKTLVWHDGQKETLAIKVAAWPKLTEPRDTIQAGIVPGTGTQPPGLGLLLAPITSAARRFYAVGDARGALVVAVDQESEAFGSGIVAGDVIEKVQGTPVTTPAEVTRAVRAAGEQHRYVALLVGDKSGAHWVGLDLGRGTAAVAKEQGSGDAIQTARADARMPDEGKL